MNWIKLWDIVYNLKLSEFSTENTYKIEARINEVQIGIVFESLTETTKYGFHIWTAKLSCEEGELFATAEDAKLAAEEIIKAIPVNVTKIPKKFPIVATDGIEIWFKMIDEEWKIVETKIEVEGYEQFEDTDWAMRYRKIEK